MARTASPLRYPGGKSSLLKLVSSILRLNRLDRGHYVEPFAGGGGLALLLLYKGDVGEVHLNDIDPAIAALWRSILFQSDDLIELMNSTEVTIEERAHQRDIYFAKPSCEVTLGFATLFLNRVNRSGIIRTGGVIGGLRQGGKYPIHCRFNKADLEARIRRIARYRSRIHFTSLDAGMFLNNLNCNLPPRSLVYADPPYFKQGAELYTSSFKHEDHAVFKEVISNIPYPWMVTYDNVLEVEKIYASIPQYQIGLYYSAQRKRTGRELLMTSRALKLPMEVHSNQADTILSHDRLSDAASAI